MRQASQRDENHDIVGSQSIAFIVTHKIYPTLMTIIENKSQTIILAIAISLTVLTLANLDLYVPSLPAIAHDLSTSGDMAQLTISFYLLGYGISHLLYGVFSDRFGRRRVLLFGLSIGVLGSLLTVIAHTIEWLLFARLVQGLGYSVGAVIARAILRDAFSGTLLAKVSSYSGMGASVTIGAAPAIGGLIQHYGHWRFNFLLIFALMILLIAFVWRYLPETNQQLDKNALQWSALSKNYLLPLKDKGFWGFTLCAGLSFGGMITYASAAPFLIQDLLGYSAAQFGFLAIFLGLAQVGGFMMNVRLLRRFNLYTIMYLAAILMLIGGMWLVILTKLDIVNLISIVGSTVIFVIGTSLIYSNAYAGALTPHTRNIGVVVSLYGGLITAYGFLTSTVVAIISERSPMGMGIIFTTLGLITFLALQLLLKSKAR